MAESKDYFGDKLRLVERAREEQYFRQLDQTLLAAMRDAASHETATETAPGPLFATLLVPVDFSEYSSAALRYAAGMAERFEASLIILHVIAEEVHTHATAAGQILGDLRERAYAALQAFVPPHLTTRPVELRVLSGHPFVRILDTAVQAQAGLIVLGTHGRTGFARALLGSVAERVVRYAPCPVLTVKAATAAEQGWLEEASAHFLTPQPVKNALQ